MNRNCVEHALSGLRASRAEKPEPRRLRAYPAVRMLRLILGAVLISSVWLLAFFLFQKAQIQIGPVTSTLSASTAMWAGEIFMRQRWAKHCG